MSAENQAAKKEVVKSKTSSDGSVTVESARGTARLSHPAPGVLLYVCAGVFSGNFYAPMVAVAQREVELAGSLLMIVDGWELRSIDTDFREAWTEWFKLHRQHFRMRLLVRTKLLDMAASLANLFTGMSVIKTYSDITAWEKACAADVPGFRRVVKASA
jgi:hypothetical protein